MTPFREMYHFLVKHIDVGSVVLRLGLIKLMGPKQQVKGDFVTSPMLLSGAFPHSVAVSRFLLTAFMFCTSLSATYQP